MRILLALIFACGLQAAHASEFGPELEQRARLRAASRQAFLNEDFRRLEEASQAYRSAASRTPSGLWHLTLFYAGIGDALEFSDSSPDREAAYAALERRTRRWTDRYPRSPAAHIAHGLALIEHGWAYRGTGYAHTVPAEAWAPFRRYLAMARQYLEQHKAVAAADPRWYEAMLAIARAEGWDRERFDRLLNEALEREPLYYQTYFAALENLLPKWHGDIREIESFARDAVRRTAALEGQGMYARIYWFASQTQFGNDLFNKSLAVWPQMKVGFDDVVARYPDPWNLNNYARFSCLARDKPNTKALLERIGTSIVAQAWQPAGLLEQCSAWSGPQGKGM